jgi:hypothetical protein
MSQGPSGGFSRNQTFHSQKNLPALGLPGQTIGNEFARNPQGLVFDTVLGGGAMFVDPPLISSNLAVNEGMMFHESLHELGLGDKEIQETLHLTVDSKNTMNITDKLEKDCVNARGNH